MTLSCSGSLLLQPSTQTGACKRRSTDGGEDPVSEANQRTRRGGQAPRGRGPSARSHSPLGFSPPIQEQVTAFSTLDTRYSQSRRRSILPAHRVRARDMGLCQWGTSACVPETGNQGYPPAGPQPLVRSRKPHVSACAASSPRAGPEARTSPSLPSLVLLSQGGLVPSRGTCYWSAEAL